MHTSPDKCRSANRKKIPLAEVTFSARRKQCGVGLYVLTNVFLMCFARNFASFVFCCKGNEMVYKECAVISCRERNFGVDKNQGNVWFQILLMVGEQWVKCAGVSSKGILEPRQLFVCKKHFAEEDMGTDRNGKRYLKNRKVIPTLNLPPVMPVPAVMVSL
jgi:hypothetical protein